MSLWSPKRSADETLIVAIVVNDRVGEAVRQWCKESGNKRSDVFVTTKILSPAGSEADTLKSLRDSVAKADIDGMC